MSDSQSSSGDKFLSMKKQLEEKGRWNYETEDKLRRQLNYPKVSASDVNRKPIMTNTEINKLFEKAREVKEKIEETRRNRKKDKDFMKRVKFPKIK